MATTGRRLILASTLGVSRQVIGLGVGFSLMPFIVHTLGDHLYGMWSLAAAFVGYSGLLDLGLASAINRFMSASLGNGNYDESNRVFNTALRLYLLLGAAVVVISGILASLAGEFFKQPHDVSIFWKVTAILGLNLALGFPLRVFIGALESNLRYDITQILDLSVLLLRAGLTVLILLLGFKVVGLACATILASVPFLFVYVYFTRRELPFLRYDVKAWSTTTAKALFSYSAFSLITQLSNILRFQIDAVVVTAVVSIAAVTHFRIAGAIAEYFLAFMISVMGAFTTVFSRQDGAGDLEAIRKTFLFATKISACVSSFIGFGLIAWGKPFIIRWMGPQYIDAYPCLVALVIGYLAALWQQPSIGLMYGISKHRFMAILSMAEGLANLGLSIILGRQYGIFGVALGTMIPLLVTKLLIQPIYVCHIIKIPLTRYLHEIGRALALAAACLVAPLLLTLRLASPAYGSLLATGGLALLCYAAPLALLVFTPEERQLLWRAARRRPVIGPT